jgi:multidrug efflux pump subunit AcrB
VSEVVLAFIRQYWKPIAYITFLALIFGFGYYKGYQHEKARFNEHLQADATLVAVAKAENERRSKEQETITANVTKEYADAVNKINDYYKSHPHVVKLCSKPNNSSTMSSKGESTSGVTTTAQGITEVDAQIASKEILQCQALIAWEKRQEEVQ